jgi:hypothetical protein
VASKPTKAKLRRRIAELEGLQWEVEHDETLGLADRTARLMHFALRMSGLQATLALREKRYGDAKDFKNLKVKETGAFNQSMGRVEVDRLFALEELLKERRAQEAQLRAIPRRNPVH